ncbi:hypothetical protein, conserved [Eimeria acervulina]|uniref:Uncharacterized protein n=1 Tax=Eimeria acervulina TaxID=5801 RepID=U6GW13_EIMAC|nr:hypothetical protein, conserved [Eimeria acervulina]CDI83468.1 hypothetical protein, conserved [Eimeria acervulina]
MLLDSFQQDQQLSLKSPEASEEVNASAGEGTEWSQAPETATETATTTAVAEQETAAVTNSFCFDAFLVSPLTRALQTASLSFHDVGSALKCPEVITEQPQPQQQHHHREHRHHQVTWLVEPLLREKFSNMTDSGTEAAELRQLLKLLCGRHEMFPALFNFALIPDGQKWWLPYLKKTLSTLQKQLRRRLRKQLLKGDAPAEEEEEGNGDDSDTLKLVDYTGLSDSDSGESVIYEAPITKAAEERPAEEKHVFAVGGAVGGPPSPAEKSVLRTLQWAGKRLQSPKAFKLRQKLWDDDAAVAAAEGRASSETWRHVEEREQLLLLLLCSTKASTFVFVSHSDFLRGLDKLDRLGNAQLRPLLLHCSPKPKVTPL